MRILLVSLSCVFLASSAIAQSIQVRSGQHDDFTRLIVDLPERFEIQIEQDTDTAKITFPGQSLKFDTSRIFRRIARERILDVTTNLDTSSFSIKFGCRCEVSSFWHDASLLVLDVRDSTDDPSFENDAEKPVDESTVTAVRSRLTLPKNANSFAASLANSQFSIESPNSPPQIDPVEEATPEQVEFSEEIISEARERLVKQIGRAASQGLLEPRTALKLETKADESNTIVSDVPTEVQPRNKPNEHVNLRAQSSVDRDFLAALNRGTNASLGMTCISDHKVNVGNWGTDLPFAKQVGNLRMELMGEFDQLNQDIAIQLAKLYLHYGFGVEAILTLALVEETSEDTVILRSLAAIMEDGYAAANSILANQLSCENSAVLWSILSYETLPIDTPVEFDSALRTFDALPSHLRSHLGPTLSRRFLEAGHQEAADKVLRILNRNQSAVNSDAQLVEAEINLSDGEQSKAKAMMQEVVETNSEPSAEALISLIDTIIQAEQGVSFDLAVLAGAYAQQDRGGALEKDLTRVYLTGLSASGAFEQSYDEYSRLSANLPPNIRKDVRSEMLHQLVQRASDVTFLKYAMVNHSTDHALYAPKVANDAAERLLSLGFAPQALPFLKDRITGALGRERQLLRSRIALAENRPRQAEAELENLTDDAADVLRAQARSQVGDHSAAATFFSSGGKPEQSLRQSWFAEDWARLMDTQAGATADIAALAALSASASGTKEDAKPESKDERVLAQNRELIQQSLAARDTIKTLLQEKPSP